MAIEKDKYSKILKRLREWAHGEGPLPQIIEAYGRLLRLQVEAMSRIAVLQPDLTEGDVASRLKQGTPAVEFEDLSLDWLLVQDLFRAVAQILAEYTSRDTSDATALGSIASNISTLKHAIRDWYQGKPLSSVAAENHVSEELLAATIQAALYPFLVIHSEALRKMVNQELWRRRVCPICGGKPDFAFLDKERGARWLLCSRCDMKWLFQRLECPYCGTQSQGALAYFTNEQELYRLYTCKKCQGYIKAIDLRRTNSEVLLPLERIITADLDRQAVEAGYKAG